MSRVFILGIALTISASAIGCRAPVRYSSAHAIGRLPPPPPDVPRELAKTALPAYTIEPPDILVVEALNIMPRSPYVLRSSDLIAIHVLPTLPDAPISGTFPIQPGGIVNLGEPYKTVNINRLTVEQAAAKIKSVLEMHVNEPVVSVSVVEMASKQQIAGQHMVGPDGTITLGAYGSVPVVGLTLAQAKIAIESYLQRFLEDPEVSVDVFAYNSKVYYVITEGAGLGDSITRFPVTGNETVLDAIANINGLTEASSKKIWIARPVPHSGELAILPVDWQGVTARGVAGTNYQVLPGDRVFVAEDKLVAADTSLGKLLAPFERAMGFTLLGTNTVTRLSGKVLAGGGAANASFGGGGVF